MDCDWCRTLLGRWEFWFKEADVEFFHVLYCGADDGEWAELEA